LLDLLLLDFLAVHTGPEDDAAAQESLLQVWKELRSCYHTGSREPAQGERCQGTAEALANELNEQTIKAQAAQIQALNNNFDKALTIIENLLEQIEKMKAKQ
jgi:hypothetical protein